MADNVAEQADECLRVAYGEILPLYALLAHINTGGMLNCSVLLAHCLGITAFTIHLELCLLDCL
jgi:hypothetical protein